MRRGLKLAALGGGLALAFMAPAVAQASTKSVYMGTPPTSGKQFQNLSADVDDYFPHGITIHVGDSVKFIPSGFHTVDFPKKGVRGGQSLFAPTGQKVSGANDAAGAPFWFNGQDQFGFNPALFPPQFGKTLTYTGSQTVESGPPIQNNPPPFTVKFTKKGSFTYYCDVHPGMKGIVHVVAKTAKAPSKKDDARTVKNEIKRDLTLAKKAAKADPGAGKVYVGYEAGQGVEHLGFLPANLTVKAGTTITFTMSKGSLEDHTATFGPGDPETPGTYLGDIAASFQGPGPFDPRAVYPSDPPGTPASLTQTTHGNGFWGSGVLDTVSSTPLPSSNTVRFDQAGTYNYYCMIHPFMHGTVTVTS